MVMKYVFGVDIGGTTVKLGFFDTEGNILEKWEIPTRKDLGGKYILPDIAESLTDKLMEKGITKEEVVGVGVGVPGPVDADGVVFKAVNLGWDIFSVSNTLGDLINLPVKAGNDANVAALGEMWKGGGKGHDDLVAVTLGTGVGGGIIVQGKLLAGATGAGGEIGHIHVEDNEEDRCGCGKKGCLEQYGSATGIVRIANRVLAATDEASVLREGELTAKAVCDAAKAKDAVAVKVMEQFGEYLGRGLAAIACVVNPEVFVIGGGVSKAGEMLFDYIRPHYEKYVFHGSKNTKFALATLGNDAGIVGAARLVLEQD
ncbi:MAG: ROK family glucokinase [Lachnospiraceae bacterium]|nr:ROK family glucokinase [Lachnospiraceae bacterium]